MPFGYGWEGSAGRGLSHASLGPRSRLKELTLSCPLTSKCAPLHTGSQHCEAATRNNYKPKWFLDKLKLATAATCNLEKAYPHLEYEIHQTIPKHLPLWCILFWNPVLLCSNGWLRTHREPSVCASWEPSYIFVLRFFFSFIFGTWGWGHLGGRKWLTVDYPSHQCSAGKGWACWLFLAGCVNQGLNNGQIASS